MDINDIRDFAGQHYAGPAYEDDDQRLFSLLVDVAALYRSEIGEVGDPLKGSAIAALIENLQATGLVTEAQRAEIKRRVAAGALAFDAKALPQWPHMIADYRGVLDVGNSFRCPGAVVFGSYRNALRALVPDIDDELFPTEDTQGAANLGLTIFDRDPILNYPEDNPDREGWDREAFGLMTDAWLDEARKRITD